MLNRKLAVAAAVLGVAVAGTAAVAGPGGGFGPRHHGKGGERLFEKIDANSDEIITRAEVAAFADERMKEFDVNRDGQITKTELQAGREARREQHQKAAFQRLDANGDGALSAEEFGNKRALRPSKGGRDRG